MVGSRVRSTTVVNRPPSVAFLTLPPPVCSDANPPHFVFSGDFENALTVAFSRQTDPDSGDDVTYTLGGADGSLFSIGPTRFGWPPNSGCLIFPHAGGLADFEDPARRQPGQCLRVHGYPDGRNRRAGDRSLTVSGTLDGPERLARAAQSSRAMRPSRWRKTTAEVGRVLADDPDEGQSIVAWDLGGPDAGLFRIGADGALAFLAAPDFERPGKRGEHERLPKLTVTATSNPDSLRWERVARLHGHGDGRAGAAGGRPAAPDVVGSTLTGLDLQWAGARPTPGRRSRTTTYAGGCRAAANSGWNGSWTTRRRARR